MTPSSLQAQIDDYLALRRGLGFQLDTPGTLLAEFARYAEGVGHHGPVTTDLAVRWALTTRSDDPAQAGRRLAAVRQFARHRAAFDPATEIPAVGLLAAVPRRRSQPHIYNDAEIAALLGQARLLLPHGGLRPATYVALFSLLASTGLRLSEACRLERDDVDLADGILTVREGKFRKSRLVPLHPTATRALTIYTTDRDSRPGALRSRGFFRTDRAPALMSDTVQKTFSRLRQRLGWTAEGRARRPRIHDLRHTFAVRRLLAWCIDGADVDRKVLALSTYLGHAKPSDTYWYLTAVPELMAVTTGCFEHFARQPQENRA
ncbi:MAG: tyrosine-type recombinase/integrase [Nitriliruptorales bacterium]|nr:tyrosine-type recombinase/integrase [Nitriliruptorales bacterium]